MNGLIRTAEWIAGRGDWAGSLLRLVVVTCGTVLSTMAYGARRDWPLGASVLMGLAGAMGLIVPFVLWRWAEWRRLRERRGNPPVRTLDLS